MSDDKFDMDAFIAGAFEGLQMVTQAHSQAWGFDKATSWSLDQDEGIIRFELEDGLTASAPAQIVGTYFDGDGSFMWAWDHPSIEPALQEAARKVRQFGQEHGYEDFTTQIVSCEQLRAWEFTAATMRINEMQGGYRGPAGGGTFIFIVFGPVQLAKSE